MKDEQWWKILSAIEKEKDLNRDNVIEKIKEELKAEDKNWYKKWEKAGFGVNYLFEVESNVFIQCEDGSLILFKDFEDEDFEDNAFTQPKDNGLTLLYLAVYNNLGNTINALLEVKGININIVDKYGCTLLHVASLRGNIGVVNYLIENGADVNAKNQDRCTPLHYAALSSNNKEIVEILVKEGADVNASLDESMITPLHMAAGGRNANQEVVQALIEKGANVKAVSKDGLTPLHVAASRSLSGEIVKTLIKGKADIDAVDKCGRTPLHFATDCFSSTNIEILIENGADYSLKNKNGEAPIDFNEHVARLAKEKE